jgi:uncharacterized protein YggE
MKIIFLFLAICCLSNFLSAQTRGNIAYNKTNNSPNYVQIVAEGDTAMVVEAAILDNEIATSFVVVFGVSQEGKTVTDATNQINKRIDSFLLEIKNLGVAEKDFYVDLITQNRIYNYQLQANNTVAVEKLAGFEIKKNISIQVYNKEMIDKLVVIASKFEIFDLIKVDYLRTDTELIKETLFKETVKIIKNKKEQYTALTNVVLLPQSRMISEIFNIQQPANAYKSYTAYEAATIDQDYDDSNRLKKVNARKMTTFYFSPDEYSVFDKVINPVIIEPVIQYTLRVKVRFLIKKGN